VEERPKRKGANVKFNLDSDEEDEDSEAVIVKKKNRKKYDD
jgi:hypothetical protein